MPIKGLSEQRRIPRVGKIHLGVKKVSERTGKEYPSATDYFVVPPEVAAVHGDKPTELPIMIPVEDEEFWASQYYRAYSQTRGLICKGDGEKCRRMIDVKTGEMASRDTTGKIEWKEMPCDGKECTYYKDKKCREVMNLQFLLPQVPGLGVWQIDTSSINSIRNINSSAELIRGIIGRIRMVPLILSLGKQEVTNPDDGKKKTVNVMSLKHGATLQNLIADSIKPIHELLAPPPDDETEPPLDVGVTPNGDEAPRQLEEVSDDLFPEDPPNAKRASDEANKAQAEQQANKSLIDLDWLRESLKTLQGKGIKAYSDESMLNYMRVSYKGVEGETIYEIAANLDKGKAKHLDGVIQDALKKA